MKKFLIVFTALLLIHLTSSHFLNGQPAGLTRGWRAGVAKVNITPEGSIWLAGYASRDHPSEGVLHDIWSKVLVIEDSLGNRAALITNDLLEIPIHYSTQIRDRLEKEYGLHRSQVILNCSHTHSGPVMRDTLANWYPLDDAMEKKVKKYSEDFVEKIVEMVGRAIYRMIPVEISAGNGTARFQVNRRNNSEAMSEYYTDLKGPNDYAVPVLRIDRKQGGIMAIVFGYACHSTVLNFYQISGDYPGFAQIELENLYPGTTALFFQGAGADQNPLPRRSVPLARQYGQTLSAAVDRVLNEKMKRLVPLLKTAYSEIPLQFDGSPPDRQELLGHIHDTSSTAPYLKLMAQTLIRRLDNGEVFRNGYPYPCQVWKLGDQIIMALGGELVVEYALELKKRFGQDVFVMGYTNDVMAYIPSDTILSEGGYEGTRSVFFTRAWSRNTQTAIINEMSSLAGKLGITPIEAPDHNETAGR
ncbi:MAG: hypothetical protein GT598_11205 [Bacteroidales bacterium]|jgi:hypothetical protein|nr:hypothetical protein [Bacteroidales bacterium]HPM18728.1 neutral/alkaline non-lysosomal ceramidase N-terminal domain-containing protein [Bacteroidales bacterium]HQG76178.1 neutral/alkaline non-lysosomal ceramidase N-terminal domain-containing protein [Bacteroidales bacterium]